MKCVQLKRDWRFLVVQIYHLDWSQTAYVQETVKHILILDVFKTSSGFAFPFKDNFYQHCKVTTLNIINYICCVYCVVCISSSTQHSCSMSPVTSSTSVLASAVVVMVIVCQCYCSAQCTSFPPILTSPAYLSNKSRFFLECLYL